ncbi:MAG: BatA domain-containing protein [Kiritimatiellaeota bacterium]|nr:BatA domain-containing protein [Kiritimatiellota bacterium]
MTLLQPTLLWGLSALTVPLIIHLLNRLRFRSLAWGAMMFLVRAARSSTRRARLRQWLILACRALALALLAWAAARPLAGGWLGLTFGGRPDTVLILFDRSASMETLDPRRRLAKREEALRLLAEAGRLNGTGSRYVLIDSATLTPQALAGPEALAGMNLARATDTAADWPALFRAALDWMLKNKSGRTDIWAVSDLQSSNWHPDDRAWADLAARLAGFSPRVRVRILALPAFAPANRALALREVRAGRVGEKRTVRVSATCRQAAPWPAPLPVTTTLNGQRAVVEFASAAARDDWNQTLPSDSASGWGAWTLPADDNLRDNQLYFVYGGETPQHGFVVAEDPAAGRWLQLAVAPSATGSRRCELAAPGAVRALTAGTVGLIVWQGAPPAGPAWEELNRYVTAGGVVLLLPPTGGRAAPGTNGPAAFAWGALATAEAAQPFRVAYWEEREGPLERTAAGLNLPVAQLAVTRRAALHELSAPPAGPRPAGWITLASYTDGQPLLARRNLGRGTFYACTTLPLPDWSDLGDGRVLVPMVQRMLEQGAARFSTAENALCGEWRPAAAKDVWTPLAPPGASDPLTQAGVWRSGDRWLALNRPAAEDVYEPLTAAQTRRLLPGVDCSVTEEHVAAENGAANQNEIWSLFVLLGLALLVLEAYLTLQEIAPPKPAGGPP